MSSHSSPFTDQLLGEGDEDECPYSRFIQFSSQRHPVSCCEIFGESEAAPLWFLVINWMFGINQSFIRHKNLSINKLSGGWPKSLGSCRQHREIRSRKQKWWCLCKRRRFWSAPFFVSVRHRAHANSAIEGARICLSGKILAWFEYFANWNKVGTGRSDSDRGIFRLSRGFEDSSIDRQSVAESE